MKWLMPQAYVLIALLLLVGFGFAQESLSFQQALALALQSPNVALSQGQLELAQKQLEVSLGILSGQFSAGYTQTWGEATSIGATGTEQTTSLDEGSFDSITLSATFNVVPFGPNADTIQKAIWGLEQAAIGLRDAQAESIVSTVQNYINSLRAQQALEFQTFAVDVANRQFEAATVRQQSGAATQQQVLQAEIALSQAQNALNEAQRTLFQTLASLSNQLGVHVDGVSDDIPQGVLPESNSEAQSQKRSDVIKAELAVKEAELNAASTTRQYLPSASLNLSYATSDEDRQLVMSTGYDTQSYQPTASIAFDPSYSQGQGNSSNSFSVNLGAKIPIETSLFPALEAARITIEQSKMQAQRVQELALLEITNSERQLAATEANVVLSQKLLDQSQQTFDTAKERLDLGVITPLDVLEAEKALREAHLSLNKAKDNYLLSLLQYVTILALDPMEVF
jgi:outer membrane protein